uniref:Uncharacterized protein n=1 Tax=Rhizophora mucronata TaxID=61149 RepID=A0A2P2QFM8_RHIMU
MFKPIVTSVCTFQWTDGQFLIVTPGSVN